MHVKAQLGTHATPKLTAQATSTGQVQAWQKLESAVSISAHEPTNELEVWAQAVKIVCMYDLFFIMQ